MFKRTFDLLLSLFASVILLPIFLLVMVMVILKSGRPIFFFQLRPGLNGKTFKIVKFRTMNNNIADNSQSHTHFGSWLRSTSLDEIPGLWNVIKGEMSLVGPRPLLIEYLPLYSKYQNRRHEVRPGITGWAQVNGRNIISWEKKFEMDVWYVDNKTFLLDLKILLLTVKKVLFREDINSSVNLTMPRFQGSEKSTNND